MNVDSRKFLYAKYVNVSGAQSSLKPAVRSFVNNNLPWWNGKVPEWCCSRIV